MFPFCWHLIGAQTASQHLQNMWSPS